MGNVAKILPFTSKSFWFLPWSCAMKGLDGEMSAKALVLSSWCRMRFKESCSRLQTFCRSVIVQEYIVRLYGVIEVTWLEKRFRNCSSVVMRLMWCCLLLVGRPISSFRTRWRKAVLRAVFEEALALTSSLKMFRYIWFALCYLKCFDALLRSFKCIAQLWTGQRSRVAVGIVSFPVK